MPFIAGAFLSLAFVSSSLTVDLTVVQEQTPQEVWMEALHQCENPKNIEKVWDTNNQWSYGKYQWQMKSWLRYKKQGATRENITDSQMQDLITRYVLDTIGDGDWYNCSKLVRKQLGAYPS